MSELVRIEQQGSVYEITLNRPDKRNAINTEMVQQFDAAVIQANRTPGLRVVVIRGEGKAFSAGVDVSNLLGLAESHGPHWQQRMRSITDEYQSVLSRLERLELPTVAVLHGYCLGLAFELALACDFRLAAAGTKVGLPETRLGMIPDVGGTTRLTRLAGPGRAKELILTGKQIDASLAESWGLVHDVVEQDDLADRVQTLVDELLAAAPLAIGMAKRVIDGLDDIDRGLMLEGWAQSQLFNTEDFLEGAQAFMMRRTPDWRGK